MNDFEKLISKCEQAKTMYYKTGNDFWFRKAKLLKSFINSWI